MKRCEDYLKSIDDIPNYAKYSNREIQLDTLTPQVAEMVDSFIRFWNTYDSDLGTLISRREPIKIYINSLGGALDAAITIMNSIKMSKTPVYTFNIGSVYKESFLVFLAGHKRYTYPDATFMYTDSMYSVPIEENDNESTFYSKNLLITNTANSMKALVLDKTSITEAQYDKHCKSEWWFSADDAFKIHIVNEICRSHYYFEQKKN